MFTSPAFPLVLPKFCIHFHVFSPATQPYESVLSRCYVPAAPTRSPKKRSRCRGFRTRSFTGDLPKNGGAPPCIVVAASLFFTPLEIPEPESSRCGR